jgi:hypothetical protein
MNEIRDRPWIWVIVAHVAIIGLLTTVLVISKKYGPQEIPIQVQHGR